MTPAVLVITVTLFAPGIEPTPAVLEFPMPDLATCERKGDELARSSDAIRRFRFVCRRVT